MFPGSSADVGVRRKIFTWFAYLALAIALQWAGGAYQGGFDRYPDEPAHFVTGLMIRSYLISFDVSHPMQFAQTYYLHYPQVSFGHWPPVFHLLLALWMLLLPTSHSSCMLLMAVLSSLLALFIHGAAQEMIGVIAAWLAGLLFVSLPFTQLYQSMVMTEIPLTLLSTLSMLSLVRLLERGGRPAAIAVGVFTSLAILTKADAWSLPLGAVGAVLALREWRRLFAATLLISSGCVLILCVPYYALTLKLMRAGMEGRAINQDRVWRALSTYAEELPDVLGVPLLLLALGGLILKAFMPFLRGKLTAFWAVLGANVFATVLFHVIVPTSAEPRKLFLIIPIAVLFAVGAIQCLADCVPVPLKTAALLALGVIAAITFRIPTEPPALFRNIAMQVVTDPEMYARAVLVASKQAGDAVAEVAALVPQQPHLYVLRANKLLASSTWNGLNYRTRYQTPDEVQQALDRIPISLLIRHAAKGDVPLTHELMLDRMLVQNPALWRKVSSIAARDGRDQLHIYQRTKDFRNQPVRFEIDLSDKIGTILQAR